VTTEVTLETIQELLRAEHVLIVHPDLEERVRELARTRYPVVEVLTNQLVPQDKVYVIDTAELDVLTRGFGAQMDWGSSMLGGRPVVDEIVI